MRVLGGALLAVTLAVLGGAMTLNHRRSTAQAKALAATPRTVELQPVDQKANR